MKNLKLEVLRQINSDIFLVVKEYSPWIERYSSRQLPFSSNQF